MSEATNTKPVILVTGYGPFPPEMADRLHVPGIRTWEIARELARNGHRVHLLGLYVSTNTVGSWKRFELYPEHPCVVSPSVTITPDEFADSEESSVTELMDRLIVKHSIVAAVGVMDVVNRQFATLKSDIPIWMDYPGDPMAERQLLSEKWETDARISEQWREYAASLARADRVSGGSRHQVGAIIGQLAAIGRLNRYTAFDPIACNIPVGPNVYPEPDTEPVLRGVEVPQDHFIIIQIGGFNNWMDEPTLFQALEIAMARNPKVHFAATGGSLGVHNNRTFDNFKRMTEGSKFRSRYHLLGWLTLKRALAALREADAGVLCDHPGVEGWVGDRHRLIHTVDHGTPLACTIGCENAAALDSHGLIFGAPQRNPLALAEAILAISADIPAARERAARAQTFLRDRLNVSRNMTPLVEWCANPVRAADLIAWREGRESPPEIARMHSHLVDAAELDALRARKATLEFKMSQLEGSRIVRAAMKLREWLGNKS